MEDRRQLGSYPLQTRKRHNFKLDENLPAELLDDLRAAGHEADTVRKEGLTGSPDAVILERVRHDPEPTARPSLRCATMVAQWAP